jgi:hypothetical protein
VLAALAQQHRHGRPSSCPAWERAAAHGGSHRLVHQSRGHSGSLIAQQNLRIHACEMSLVTRLLGYYACRAACLPNGNKVNTKSMKPEKYQAFL